MLLIDPSEKGALPLYTGLIAEALTTVGLKPVVLSSRRLLLPEIDSSWPVHRWLPAERWPRPPDAPSQSRWRQGLAWLSCATVIVSSVLLSRPGIIHFQHPIHIRFDPFLLGILKLFAPVVWTAHDTVPHDPSTNTVDRAKRIYTLADVVLVHSSPAAEDVARISGVHPVVVSHPVRQVSTPPDRATARRQLGLEPHGRVAAAIGFIRAYKGYRLLADVWDRLGESAPILLVVGQLVDQSESDAIHRLKSHPRADVRLGYASDGDVIAAFAAADVVLLPHERGSDSGSLHLARAVGTPVISSDSPQLAAVVANASAGLVLPRDVRTWAEALTGELPPPPPPPPPPIATGQEHLAAYNRAIRSRQARKDGTPRADAPRLA